MIINSCKSSGSLEVWGMAIIKSFLRVYLTDMLTCNNITEYNDIQYAQTTGNCVGVSYLFSVYMKSCYDICKYPSTSQLISWYINLFFF